MVCSRSPGMSCCSPWRPIAFCPRRNGTICFEQTKPEMGSEKIGLKQRQKSAHDAIDRFLRQKRSNAYILTALKCTEKDVEARRGVLHRRKIRENRISAVRKLAFALQKLPYKVRVPRPARGVRRIVSAAEVRDELKKRRCRNVPCVRQISNILSDIKPLRRRRTR